MAVVNSERPYIDIHVEFGSLTRSLTTYRSVLRVNNSQRPCLCWGYRNRRLPFCCFVSANKSLNPTEFTFKDGDGIRLSSFNKK